MSKKISKEDLKSPDQVTQTLRQGFVWTTSHSKIVITVVLAFIVVGSAISLVGYFADKKEMAQQEKYFLLEKAYTQKKSDFEATSRAETMAAQNKNSKTPPPAVDPAKKATGDLEKDYGTVVANFESFINEEPKTKAAQMAALNLSDIYLTYNKTDEAIAILDKVQAGLDKDDVLTSLVWMQLGNAQANKQDCQSAIQTWQKIVSTKKLTYSHGEAKLRMGLCFESMNDLTKAEEIYTEVSKADTNGGTDFNAAQEAQKYLRLLKAKKNL